MNDASSSAERPALRTTRRQFAARPGGLGGCYTGGAGDPARPEPEREAQHRRDRRRRTGREQSRRRRVREHRGALRRVRADHRPGRAPTHPKATPLPRLPQALRPCQRLRRRGRQHHRAHARLRHPAGAAARQARLLREAADPQHLGGPHHSRGRRARPRWPRRWARRSTPATTTAASSS